MFDRSQEKDNVNMEHEESTLKPQDSTPTSINISRETKPNHDLEAKVEKTKSFAERWKTNRFWLVRVSYHVLHWVVEVGS